MKFALTVLLALVGGLGCQSTVLAATGTDAKEEVLHQYEPADVSTSTSSSSNARLAARQVTREKLMARQLAARHGHGKRTGSSPIPVLPTVCGTLPGALFLLRATTPDTGSYDDLPASAPGYVSTSKPGNGEGDWPLTVYFTTNLEFADTYYLDEKNGCALTGVGVDKQGTIRADVNSLDYFGSTTLQGVDTEFDVLTNYQTGELRCTVIVGLVSCTVHDTPVSFRTERWTTAPGPKSFLMITIDPDRAYLSFNYVTLTLVPVGSIGML